MDDPQAITPRDLADRLARGEPLSVLDVREDVERAFAAIAIPETAADLHVPMNQVPSRLAEVREASARGPTVVYCHHGVRSGMVADWLTRQGVPGVLNLDGGIDAWSLEVDPRVRRY
jgi:rhodanese-related sulfurtransferase